MVTPVEKNSSNKFYEFHNDKGYNTDECVQLRKHIEELTGPNEGNSRVALTVKGVLADEALLAEIVLETETAPVALKNHIVIPVPPTRQGTCMDITLVTGTAPVAWRREGERIPVISHVGERHQQWGTLKNKKGASQQMKKTCPYPEPARM
nr:hypothetical protein [Tanacetum cinerariifolium]